ncbi:hypothetical protein METHB2_700016 [Candidatus Methylobacter favarea]|uniref:Uncharacterized protein n=1 Tax=Candidatus Methylobacter favarea TaxID=2707345 RepID=A0A8S0WS69_9GAMM|nr:EAL domain-containing protein [Candidatus Methylobacter favarea]CAA9892521.1 hypothetical protein METHB2_700016 [Candidatus Methylobacter favarea]
MTLANFPGHDKVFVKALTAAVQAFGKKTVAEFVENEAIVTISERVWN